MAKVAQEIAKTEAPKLPDFVDQSASGTGISTAAEDNVIPLVYKLQDKMKYVKKGGPDYVEGAAPGMLMLRNADQPLFAGDEGFLFQPCYRYTEVVEWAPRGSGGGIQGRHAEVVNNAGALSLPNGQPVKLVPHPENPKRMVQKLDNGNELVETRNFMGRVHLPNGARLPYCIPMASTDLQTAKLWNTSMLNKLNSRGQPLDIWVHLYRIKIKQRNNAFGDWYAYDVKWENYVPTEADIIAGKAMYEACAAGHQRAAETESRLYLRACHVPHATRHSAAHTA